MSPSLFHFNVLLFFHFPRKSDNHNGQGSKSTPLAESTEPPHVHGGAKTKVLLLQLQHRANWGEFGGPSSQIPHHYTTGCKPTGGLITKGHRSPAASNAGGFSTGGTDGSQSTSQSSLFLQPHDNRWQQGKWEKSYTVLLLGRLDLIQHVQQFRHALLNIIMLVILDTGTGTGTGTGTYVPVHYLKDHICVFAFCSMQRHETRPIISVLSVTMDIT